MKFSKSSDTFIYVFTFVSTLLIYFFLGIKYWIWHLNWIIFILVPIVISIRKKLICYRIIYPISLFSSVFIFILLAVDFKLLSIAWIVLIVESVILLTLSSDENFMNIFSLMGFYMVVLAYVGVNVLHSLWYSSLAILFIIPLMIKYSDKGHRKNQINSILYFVLPCIFLFIEIVYQSSLSFIILSLILLGTFLQGYLYVKIDFKLKNDRIIILYSIFISIVLCILSIGFNLWLYSGISLLSVPIIVLIAKGYKNKVSAYFAWLFAAIIFVSALFGYALEVYSITWYYLIIMFTLSVITPSKRVKNNEGVLGSFA